MTGHLMGHLSVRHGARELAGVVREGESVGGAAERIAATVVGDPVAVDLSADPMEFVVDPDVRVGLRAMTHGDLADVIRWRQSDHVHRWWAADGEPSQERVTAQLSPDIDGRTPTRMWVAEANGRSIGFVQDYRLADYPDSGLLAPDPGAVGVDYAIGEQAWLGRGVGVRMLWAWLLRVPHRFPQARSCFAAPDHRNLASLRVLEKVGFEQGTWFDEPAADGSTVTVVGHTLDLARVVGAAGTAPPRR